MVTGANRRLTSLLLLAAIPLSLFALEESLGWQIDRWVDWYESALYVRVTAPLPTAGRNLPAAEHSVRRDIEREIAALFYEALVHLRLDSYQMMSDRIDRHDSAAADLLTAARSPQMTRVRRTADMRNVEVEYRIELFPQIARTVMQHRNPLPLPRVSSWVPTRRYTGVVIFAQGELPVHGERARAQLQPAMLPEIYDQNLTRILSHEMLDGDLARSRSIVHYAGDIDDPVVQRIAGPDPLRVNAAALFGRQFTDVIIPQWAADRLLYGEHNLALLNDARIVVVISPRKLHEPLP